MIRDFTEFGLLPAGIHTCTLQQMHAVFGSGVRREQLLEGLTRCFRLMHDQQLQGVVLIDGSFVTDKERPDDLEVTLDVRNESRLAQDRALLFYDRRYVEVSRMGVDWYPTLPGKQDFTIYFQRVREETLAARRLPAGTLKGILRLDQW